MKAVIACSIVTVVLSLTAGDAYGLYQGSRWNLYEYVESAPTVHTDATGLDRRFCISWSGHSYLQVTTTDAQGRKKCVELHFWSGMGGGGGDYCAVPQYVTTECTSPCFSAWTPIQSTPAEDQELIDKWDDLNKNGWRYCFPVYTCYNDSMVHLYDGCDPPPPPRERPECEQNISFWELQ